MLQRKVILFFSIFLFVGLIAWFIVFREDIARVIYHVHLLIRKILGSVDIVSIAIEPADVNCKMLLRRNKVKEMMKHAWDSYVRHAWGMNELCPCCKDGNFMDVLFGKSKLGTTIIDSLDTLYIMGLHEEFSMGRDWVENYFDLNDVNVVLSVFEANIRLIGGLLSCFSLTGDIMFRDKAELVAKKLLPAFESPTGIPYRNVKIKDGTVVKDFEKFNSVLSEFGTLYLEFSYLSNVTGNEIYDCKVQKIYEYIQALDKPYGLYPLFLNPQTGKWGASVATVGGGGDSFFEYLLKAWIMSGKRFEKIRQIYDDAMQTVITYLLKTSKSGLMYFSFFNIDSGNVDNKMEHLSCFLGGLISLGGVTLINNMTERYMEIGTGITDTCHETYTKTATGLGPEVFSFNKKLEAKADFYFHKCYSLRPETVESYFYLWRITKQEKYRIWGWDVVTAIEDHCRTEYGYYGIRNVYDENSVKLSVQHSYFLAETLKYLYLLFSDDSLLSLDEWVFNTEGHPLPIEGSPFYRKY